MTYYLDASDLITIATGVSGGDLVIRDGGLLDCACFRPQSTVLGVPAYPTLWLKAASIIELIVMTKPLANHNWRLGWLAMVVFCDLNEYWVDADDLDALDLLRRISRGESALSEVADEIQGWAVPKGSQ